MILIQEDIDRFWSGIDRREVDDCWPWLCYCNVQGYGTFKLNGGMEKAHRVAYVIMNGQIPELFEDLPAMICHKCDNPRCANPNHLFLGNSKINQKDCAFKGRRSYPKLWQQKERFCCQGENSSSALKTEVEVKEIKVFLREGVLTQKQIAEKHGLSQAAVSAINLGKTWSHVIL